MATLLENFKNIFTKTDKKINRKEAPVVYYNNVGYEKD